MTSLSLQSTVLQVSRDYYGGIDASSIDISPWETDEDVDEEGPPVVDLTGVEDEKSNDFSPSPEEAVRCIVKNYRLSKAFLDFVWKDAHAIAALPAEKLLFLQSGMLDENAGSIRDLRRCRSMRKAIRRIGRLRFPINSAPVDLQTADKAARIVQGAWRRSSAGFHLLRRFQDFIVTLPPEKYKSVCNAILPMIRTTGLRVREHAINRICLQVKRDRENHVMRQCLPVCFDNDPTTRTMHVCLENVSNQAAYERMEDGSLFLTPQVVQNFENQPKASLETKEVLDALIKGLRQLNDVYVWDNIEEGCYARCQLIIDMLRLTGIPDKDFCKQYVILPISCRKYDWMFHTAPVITLSDGKQYVVDPGLSDEALTLEEWIALQKNDSAVAARMRIKDAGHFSMSGCDGLEFNYNPHEEAITFTSHRSMHVHRNKRLREWRLYETSEAHHAEHLGYLAECRVELENDLLITEDESEEDLP